MTKHRMIKEIQERPRPDGTWKYRVIYHWTTPLSEDPYI